MSSRLAEERAAIESPDATLPHLVWHEVIAPPATTIDLLVSRPERFAVIEPLRAWTNHVATTDDERARVLELETNARLDFARGKIQSRPDAGV